MFADAMKVDRTCDIIGAYEAAADDRSMAVMVAITIVMRMSRLPLHRLGISIFAITIIITT